MWHGSPREEGRQARPGQETDEGIDVRIEIPDDSDNGVHGVCAMEEDQESCVAENEGENEGEEDPHARLGELYESLNI